MGMIGQELTTYGSLAGSKILASALLLVSTLAALFSPLARLQAARGDERQQLKWFLYAAVPAAVCLSVFLVEVMISNYTINSMFETMDIMDTFKDTVSILSFTDYDVFYGTSYEPAFALLILAVFTCVAILRYRLYDIDLLINRTLVYGALSAGVVGIYVLTVVTLGALFQARGNLGVSLLATGLVAVLFQPLRSRLQRGVNRLMYGERDDPYAVLSRLGRRVETTIAPKAALNAIVETIAQALKAPYVAITVQQSGGDGFARVAEHGTPKGELVVLPLVYQQEKVGQLLVAPRAPRETFSQADTRLLEDLARQVEVAVHAVRLTADLQHSRERLVTTREEERRRLRRDLHDGLGPTLGALTLGLDTTRLALAQDDPKAVNDLLVELKGQSREAVSDVRRLVYGLRPPALDDLG